MKPQAVGPVGDDLARQLADIELRLSRMVAAPVNLWNTQRLERDAAQLLGRAQNAADRDAVQTTMNKIHQFALIGQKSGQVPSAFAQGGQAGVAPAPGAVAAAPGATMVNGIAARRVRQGSTTRSACCGQSFRSGPCAAVRAGRRARAGVVIRFLVAGRESSAVPRQARGRRRQSRVHRGVQQIARDGGSRDADCGRLKAIVVRLKLGDCSVFCLVRCGFGLVRFALMSIPSCWLNSGESSYGVIAVSRSAYPFATLEEWVAREAIGFDLASTDSSNAAVDGIVGVLGGSVELLGLGEPTHGVEDFLVLRNRVFERLVEVHGFSAIAIESSFPRGRLVNEYVAGHSAASIEEVLESGTSHGFGRLAANRRLVEWMRAYNADASHAVKLGFYGFDAPMEMMGADSPRQLLELVLDYLADGEAAGERSRRERIESLLGEEAAWSNPAAAYEPAKSVGLSANAIALQQETELLIHELQARGEELNARFRCRLR